jgi:hypothetical protein
MRISRHGSSSMLATAMIVVLVAAVALAADLDTAIVGAGLSGSNRVQVCAGGPAANFTINIWATGNLANVENVTGAATVGNSYTLTSATTATTNSSANLTFQKGVNYTQNPGNPGGSSNPYVVVATLDPGTLAAGSAAQFNLTGAGSQGLTWDTTPATVYVDVILCATATVIWQPPVNIANKGFKRGSTIPVQFILSNGNCMTSSNKNETFYIQVSPLGPVANPPLIEDAGSSNGDVGNAFRCDSTSGNWIFNLQTKGWESGSYDVHVLMGASMTMLSPSQQFAVVR